MRDGKSERASGAQLWWEPLSASAMDGGAANTVVDGGCGCAAPTLVAWFRLASVSVDCACPFNHVDLMGVPPLWRRRVVPSSKREDSRSAPLTSSSLCW
ncbi:hypothetical protein NL676_027234 [Syzygium grande]|nr:hypothetical protein NL676_027234 [Syzygium grande]